MTLLRPPPLRDFDHNSPSWQNFYTDIAYRSATVVDDPNIDNFAALDREGNVKDSGVDQTSFVAESDFDERAIILLGSATINAQTLTKQEIYVVPTGNKMIPFGVMFRSPSASLAGLTDLDLGGNADADDWIQQITLNAFVNTTDYGLIVQPEQAAGPPIVPVRKTEYATSTVFGIKINTGSTNPATFVVDLFGYVF